jgi:hypothetical protein
MSAEEELRPAGSARLPRWQQLVLIALCLFGLAAAAANVAVAHTGGGRAFHAGFGIVIVVVLRTLVRSYRRRA